MKLTKILAVALAALTLSACSDDDPDYSTTPGVTVQMQKNTMVISEDLEAGRYFTVPVELSTEANGPVSVTVEVKSVETSPAIEDKDYRITSKTIVIPAGELVGGIEFYPIGDDEINDDRQFIMTITSARGAAIGQDASCLITLKDNEGLIPNAYAQMAGTWTFKATDDDGPVEFDLVCQVFPESSDYYTKALVFTGWMGYNWTMAVANFSFDASTNQAIITFPLGQWIADEVNFGSALGVCDVMLASVSGNSLVVSGSISATVDENFETISFSDSAEFIGAIFSGSSFTGYTWFWWDTMSMERK